LPIGLGWLYVPRGFVCPEGKWSELEQTLLDLARSEGAAFVKIEPFPHGMCITHGMWKWLGGRAVQPAHTVVLDLSQDEKELLAGMHQKTRYNIRLAEKKGVRIEFSNEPEMVETFLKLNREVAKRSGFGFHADEYYRKMQAVLSPAGMFEIGLAYLNDKPLAAHILISYGGVTTYAHGASSSLSRSVMAPALLQWRSIQRARERGVKQYDFYGVAPKDADNLHPWAGITRFKLGFGGKRIDYPGAFDYSIQSG
jgi:lipid II:glycine glycyltransferase (peptidoglycan interpeptide bridge formation enzyme)